MPDKRLDIAVVGCGAVTEHKHLPFLSRRADCRVTVLVDHDESRAKGLAARFGVSRTSTEYRAVLGLGVDAAVVALPNHLHAPVSIELLEAGIHVLVEKPMAPTVAECDAMVKAAGAGHAVLAVGLMRRFLYSGRFVKWAVESGLLGRITSFDIRDGGVFNWPLASNSFFRKETACGGVLMDTGAHTLDQMLWWLGEVGSFEYVDDNYGGVEAECELQVRLKSGAEGIVVLSRRRNLRNTAIIRGEEGELEVGLGRNHLSLSFRGSPVRVTGQGVPWEPSAIAQQTQGDLMDAEHDDLFESIRTGQSPTASGAEGRRSVALIEACYRERGELQLPWMSTRPAPLAKVGG